MTPLRLEAGVTQSPYYTRRQRQARARRIKRIALISVLGLVLVGVASAIVYAGSPGTMAKGIKIDSVGVGGLSSAEAIRLLERRSAPSLGKPIRFTVEGHGLRAARKRPRAAP